MRFRGSSAAHRNNMKLFATRNLSTCLRDGLDGLSAVAAYGTPCVDTTPNRAASSMQEAAAADAGVITSEIHGESVNSKPSRESLKKIFLFVDSPWSSL